jgi:uncharacterized protein YoxC
MTTYEWIITIGFIVVILALWNLNKSVQDGLRKIEQNTDSMDATLEDILRQLGGGEEEA